MCEKGDLQEMKLGDDKKSYLLVDAFREWSFLVRLSRINQSNEQVFI